MLRRYACLDQRTNESPLAHSPNEQCIQKTILNLMAFDSYPKFLKSDMYKRYTGS